ncbi:MAG TPA: hypothetical protein VL200_09830 [Lacunisphaera sp.]|nr:hypothetical protein [Lacunisphaera sp.]
MSPPPSQASSHGIHVPRYAIWLFALVCLAPWLVLLRLDRKSAPPEHARVNAAANGGSRYIRCKPGPWGDLEYTRIVIEPPEALIDLSEISPRPTAWVFKGYTPASLAALWHAAPLTAAQSAAIDARQGWETNADGIIIRPTTDFIVGLSPETRAKIYSALAEFDENPDQKEPFRFRADGLDEWIHDGGLAPDTVALMRQLLYHRGTSLLLSDASLLLARLPRSDDRIQLVKTLARKSTLLVRLRVRPDTNFDGLDDYWDRGLRTKDLKPFLQSLVRGSDTNTVDLIHLLPRLPRSLLYTYPAVNEAGTNSFLDCHWTVLNFFNLTPDERFQHLDAVTAALLHDYYVVTGTRTFGDILLFARPDGTVIHSCVFLADNIVFTKNGSSQNSPWILMTLPDVIAYYPSDTPIDIQTYRRKQLAGGPGT